MKDKKRENLYHRLNVIEFVLALIISLALVNGILFGLLDAQSIGFWSVPLAGILTFLLLPIMARIVRHTIMYVIVFAYVFLFDSDE